MNITTHKQPLKPASKNILPLNTNKAEVSAAPQESLTLSDRKEERGGLGTMLRRGASWGAFMGVPAAAGALGAQLGASASSDDGMGKLLGSIVGGGVGQAYGAVHGGYAGWEITPGKKAGGIMLAMLTVPVGAGVGALAATGLSIAGSAGGWPVAAGLAGAGFAIGMVNGYMDPKPGEW